MSQNKNGGYVGGLGDSEPIERLAILVKVTYLAYSYKFWLVVLINFVMRRDSSFCNTLRNAKFRTLAYAYIFKSLISARDC